MLEKNGIDFLVMEAYPEIAPQVGANIGLLPNGQRILDQLGCYETFLKLAETPVENLFIRNPEGGGVMASFEKVSSQSIERSVPVTSVSLLVNILHYDRHGYQSCS